MPLPVPQIDDRTYDALRRDALARIPVHNPEWTNFNESDPGVTLLELYAFLVDTLLYRANRIPDRNRRKFLRLLSIPIRPPSAAKGLATISNERGPLEPVVFPAGVPLLAGKVEFRTQDALEVLPVEARLYVRRRLSLEQEKKAQATYNQLFDSFTDDSTELEFYETVPVELPASGADLQPFEISSTATVDSTLWIALLTRPREEALADTVRHNISGRVLTLGLAPYLANNRRRLRPGGAEPGATPPPLIFEIATGRLDAQNQPLWERLDARYDGNPLEEVTLVELVLPAASSLGVFEPDPVEDGVGDFPPAIDDDKLTARLLTWVRMKVSPAATDAASFQIMLSWAGINASGITQRVEVVGEPLGRGTGEPDQLLKLANTPVVPDSVRLTVDGEPWRATDDLLAAPPEVPVPVAGAELGAVLPEPGDPKVFQVDSESGEVRFGDGLRGARPPANSIVRASYAYGGGSTGNVGIGAVKTAPTLPSGFKAFNPLPTWGGADGETMAEAERSIPRYLRHRDRAVSKDDFEDLVWQTPGIDLGRLEVLPLFHPEVGSPTPGAVTLLVIPAAAGGRTQAPEPSQFFLDAVCAWIEPRRVVTSEVWVTGPLYVGLTVSVGIDPVPGREFAPVREAVKQAMREFLSPLTGGQEGHGWPLEKAVEDRELWARAARVDGVAKVRGVRMWDASGKPAATIDLVGLELSNLLGVEVSLGEPEDLVAPAPAGPAKKRLPVPVLPEGC